MIAWRLVNRHFVVYRRDWLAVSYTHLDVYKRQTSPAFEHLRWFELPAVCLRA